ncbi:hypothetical protein D3C78_852830 [compost metagenome]
MVFGQFQLCIQDRLLAFKLRIVTIQIQTDLPYRHQFLAFGSQFALKRLNVLVQMLFNHNRMQTQSGVQRSVRPGQIEYPIEMCSFDCRDDYRLDSCAHRLLNALRFMPRKRRKIKVAMGVDKAECHARSSLSKVVSLACGASISGVATTSFATAAGGTTNVGGVMIRL